MPQQPPIVYILHGEDGLALGEFVGAIRAKLGDSSIADMNTNWIELKGLTISRLRAECFAAPFLAKRRLVILDGYLTVLTGRSARAAEGEEGDDASPNSTGKRAMDEFLAFLEEVPVSTALVLIEKKKLPATNAALKWAASHAELSFVREFAPARGAALVPWIQKRAQASGGAFSPQAAQLLAATAGEDAYVLTQEIEKLLTFAAGRPVQPEDVTALTPESAQTSVFDMVDAIGGRDGSRAMRLLRRTIEQGGSMAAFGMIVRQFRLLLQAREALESGTPANALAAALGLHPYVAQKVAAQARGFTLSSLEAIFFRLRDIDEDAKLGRVELDAALECLAFDLAR
jgi:DNA polymerase III subunit delta